MKRLLILLVPLLLYAQVEVDTVIRLPSFIQNGYFIPELNKLYILGQYEYYVLDCSTYQIDARIPRPWDMGLGYFSWNSRRQKLYVGASPFPDSTLVIDATADTALTMLPSDGKRHAYSTELDRLYLSATGSMRVLDCAADTVVRRITSPVPDHGLCVPTWDSVGRKLYVGLDSYSAPALLAVYDCIVDSFLAVIDIHSAVISANVMNFDYAHHKAYFVSSVALGPQHAGVIDIERDSLVKVFDFRVKAPAMNPVAINTKDEKVYIPSNWSTTNEIETLYVIDPATDSFLKKIPIAGFGPENVCWVPWSNRVYMTSDHDRCLRVLDCRTDSLIVPRLQLGYWGAANIQLDPIRERIFIIGAESTTVHVLRDVEAGVTEPGYSEPTPTLSGLQVHKTAGGYDLRYDVASPCRVVLTVHDLLGREVRRLVADNQATGEHHVRWDRTDATGAAVAQGVYLARLDMPGLRAVEKLVVQR